jgi:chromosomal replication initiation ATPase DnaA
MRQRNSAKEVQGKYRIQLNWLINRACEYTGANKENLLSKSRLIKGVDARCIIVQVLKRHTSLSTVLIGELINRDHATVIHANICFWNLYETKKDFALHFDQINADYQAIFGSKTDFATKTQYISSQIFASPFRQIEDIVKVLIR